MKFLVVFCLLFILIASPVLALLPQQEAGDYITLEWCMTRFGYSHQIIDENFVGMGGINIGTQYIEILQSVPHNGTIWVDTDTGPRQIWVYIYKGEEYWFIPRHRNDPGAGLDHHHWHGACMYRRQ